MKAPKFQDMESTETYARFRIKELNFFTLYPVLGTTNTFVALGSLALSLLFSKACHASQLSRYESLLRKSFSLPASGSALWYRTPAANWVFESLPIGNGYMGGGSSMQFHDSNLMFLDNSAAVFGGVENDTVVLNIDTLWEGGPFADPVRSLTLELILSDDRFGNRHIMERTGTNPMPLSCMRGSLSCEPLSFKMEQRSVCISNRTLTLILTQLSDLNNITSEAGQYGTILQGHYAFADSVLFRDILQCWRAPCDALK
jgi:hypothetical protein